MITGATLMDEISAIAAVMTAGIAPALREKGQSVKVCAEKAVEMYLAIHQVLARLPTNEAAQPSAQEQPSPQRQEPAPSPGAPAQDPMRRAAELLEKMPLTAPQRATPPSVPVAGKTPEPVNPAKQSTPLAVVDPWT